MVWFAMLLGVGGLLLLIVRFMIGPIQGRGVVTALGALGLIAGAVAMVGASMVAVPAGHVGVPVLFGRVQVAALSEGLHFINPFAEVTNLSVRTETYSMEAGEQHDASVGNSYAMSSIRKGGRYIQEEPISVLSSDGLQLVMDATVMYRLEPGDAPLVLQKFGPDYVRKIIRPAARAAVREAASEFTSQEAYSLKRAEMTARMKEKLVDQIRGIVGQHAEFASQNAMGFRIEQMLLRNVDLPATVKEAIEVKLAAEQEAQRMQFIIQKETQEADRKRIEAQGIADFQDIVSKGINEDLLRWKGIEATMKIAESPNAKVIVIGGGSDGLPLILNPSK